MADIKEKIKSWLNKEQKELRSVQNQGSPMKKSAVPDGKEIQTKEPRPLPETKKENPEIAPATEIVPGKDAVPFSPAEKGEWELRHSALSQQQEEVQKKLSELAQELAHLRKNFQDDLRKKEEEKIKLLAQLSLSDSRAQNLLDQQHDDFGKIRREAQKEIETLEKRLQEETASWSKELYEMEKTQEEFLSTAEFQLQEKQLEKKRKEQGLEKNIAELQNQISKLSTQIQSEKQRYLERIKTTEDESISLRSQLQLRESNRRLQEQKLQQDLSQSRSESESQIHSLEIRLEQERQQWQEKISLKEAEFRALKIEEERRMFELRLALRKSEEGIHDTQSRAEAKLKLLEEETQRARTQNAADLQARQEAAEKLKVELMLLDSQLKVDAEKSEAALLSLQKEAAGKITFLETKIQEELRAGEKAIESKQAEIESLEVQFSTKRKALQEEFNQKKTEIDQARQALQKKLKEAGETIERERENHHLELLKRDELITNLKQEMSHRSEENRQSREQFAAQLEAKRQEMAQHFSEVEEKFKSDKQALLESLSTEGKLLSEKKAALAREQTALQHALKKQEEQLLFEIRPLNNQLLDLKNRLEQERASRAKIVGAKEEILRNLATQKHNQEETLSNESKQFEIHLKKEESAAQEKLDQILKKWDQEKSLLEESLRHLQKEQMEVERTILDLPAKTETEKAALLALHQKEREELKNLYDAAQLQMCQETEQFKKSLQRYEKQQSEMEKNLSHLLERVEKERKDHEKKLADTSLQWEKKIDKTTSEIEQQRSQMDAELALFRKKGETAQQELVQQQSVFENDKTELEKQWNAERSELEKQLAALKETYDAQKLIWHNALLERSTHVQGLEVQIEKAKERHQAALAELEKRRQAAEEEFKNKTAALEKQEKLVQSESAQKLQEKRAELAGLENSLDEFLRQSKEYFAGRSVEISEQRSDLQNQIAALQKELELETQRSPEILSQKDLEISFLKSDLSLKESAFRSEWEKEEKDFEQFKKLTTEKVQGLQQAILSEHHSVELKLSELEKEIESLRERRAKEEESAQHAAQEMEEESASSRAVLSSEIAGLEKKILQEKNRAEQQIKVKEMEIASLRRNLEQREIQRSLAKESRQKEIVQERLRLADWENALRERLGKEKSSTEKILQSKQQELNSLKEKFRFQEERIQSEQLSRQRELSEAKAKLEIRSKELSKILEDEMSAWQSSVQDKETELDQLSNKLNLWSQTVKLEEEQERLKWDDERQEMENKIHQLETALADERSGLDQIIQQRSEEIVRLTDRLNRSQQEYVSQLNEFQKQKNGVAAEEGKWEEKLKAERARLKDEMRQLDREIERLDVQLSLKETQVSIEKQKRERESRWARRPLETKLAELMRRWEEREKEQKRKMAIQESERARLSAEIKQAEESIRKELHKRESVLGQMRSQLEKRLKQMEETFNQEHASAVPLLQQKWQEAGAMKNALQKLEELSKESESGASSAGLEDLRAKIDEWEKKLEDSFRTERVHLEEGTTALGELQKELSERKKSLEKQELKSAKVATQAKNESEKFRKMVSEINESSHLNKEQAAQARAYIESGLAAFSIENFQEALICFNQALNLDPDSEISYQMRGVVYEKQGDASSALESFSKALELNPGNDFIRKHIQELNRREKE